VDAVGDAEEFDVCYRPNDLVYHDHMLRLQRGHLNTVSTRVSWLSMFQGYFAVEEAWRAQQALPGLLNCKAGQAALALLNQVPAGGLRIVPHRQLSEMFLRRSDRIVNPTT
jgi:hypothetical protein